MKNVLKKGIATIMAAAALCMGTLPALAEEPEETVIETTAAEEPETEVPETKDAETKPSVPDEFIWGEMNPYDYEWVSACIYTEEDGWYFYQCIKGQTWRTLVKENPEELSIVEDYGQEIVVLHTSWMDYYITTIREFVSPDTVVAPYADYCLDLIW